MLKAIGGNLWYVKIYNSTNGNGGDGSKDGVMPFDFKPSTSSLSNWITFLQNPSLP